jgi:O-antigen/teichoic acid export membrane protein
MNYMESDTSLFSKIKTTGKHGIIYGIGSSLQQAITIILVPIYTTYLSTAEYGTLGLIRITAQLAGSIFWLGLTSALFRSYFDYEDEAGKKKVVSTTLLLLLGSCITAMVLTLLFSSKLSVLIFGSDEFSDLLILSIANGLFVQLMGIPMAIFRARKMSVQYSVFQILSLLLGIGLTTYFIVVLELKILGAILGTFIASALVTLLMFVMIRKEMTWSVSRTEVRKLLSFGIPLIPAMLSAFVFHSANRYVLKIYHPLEDVGLFNLAYQFGLVILVLFVRPIKLIWPPMFYSYQEDPDRDKFFSRTFTLAFLIGTILFLFLSTLSKDVLILMSDETYWSVYTIVPFIALGYLIWGLENILNISFAYKRKTRIMAIYFAIGAAVNLLLNFMLIPEHGMKGAAISTLVSFAVMFVFVLFYNRKLLPVDYEWVRILKIAVVGGAVFLGCWFPEFPSLASSMIIKTLLIGTVPMILYLIRFFNPYEIARIKGIFAKLFKTRQGE